jgi:hypothetical protein
MACQRTGKMGSLIKQMDCNAVIQKRVAVFITRRKDDCYISVRKEADRTLLIHFSLSIDRAVCNFASNIRLGNCMIYSGT